jgi:hypothetical protein
MTVFCWDGKTLATDSRRSRKKSMTHHDNARKLRTKFGTVQFQGSPIRAIARAGSRRQTNLLCATLRSGTDVLGQVRQMWADESMRHDLKGSLFVITDDKRWLLRVEPTEGVTLEEVTEQKTVAGGTGGTLATFLMNVYGFSARDAVGITKLYRSCCGGPTRYIRLDRKRIAIRRDSKAQDITIIDQDTVSWFADVARKVRETRKARELSRLKSMRIVVGAEDITVAKFLMYMPQIKTILNVSDITFNRTVQGFVVVE